MSFDPDAYLAATAPAGSAPPPAVAAAGFDPDAYLKATETQWSDVPGNAWEDLKGVGKSLYAVGEKAVGLPNEARDTAAMMALGKNFGDTPIGEDVHAAGEIVKRAPGAIVDRAKDLITHPIRSFKEHPVNTVMDVGAVLAPFIEGTEAGRAGLAAAKEAGQGAVSAIADPLAEGLDTAANAMGRRAAGFTKRFLNTEGKREASDDAVQWMLKNKVMTPGVDPEEMLARTEALKNMAGEDIGGILQEQNHGATRALSPKSPPQLREQFLFQPQDAIEELDGMRPRAGGRVLQGGEYDDLNGLIDNAINTIKAHGGRPIPWTEANDLKGVFQDMVNYDTTKSKAFNGMKRSIAAKFKDSLDSQLQGTMEARGQDVAPFLSAKETYGTASRAEGALNNKISSEAGNRQIGLTDTIAGAGGATVAGAPGAAVTIIAKKAFEKYGITTGASLADHLADIVREAPEAFGKYAGQLTQAASRGNQALAVQHFLLQQTEPEYRQMLEGLGQ